MVDTGSRRKRKGSRADRGSSSRAVRQPVAAPAPVPTPSAPPRRALPATSAATPTVTATLDRPVARTEPKSGRFQGFVHGSVVMTLASIAGLGLALLVSVIVRPSLHDFGEYGAVLISATFTYALAARIGGRPILYGILALIFGGTVIMFEDGHFLRGGAAILTAMVTGVLAVMGTVPAVTFPKAARETMIAVGLSCVGALAVVGYEPRPNLDRFEYVALGLSLALGLLLVYRLGAGLHGLGTRGLVVVMIGSVMLGIGVAYAELLRRYGTPVAVDQLYDAVGWTRRNLGAVPRPIMVFLGIPALVWGCHMRARRRQGWWVCAFGVAGTTAIACALINPAASLAEASLTIAYSVVAGLAFGYAVIRIDLAFTGSRSTRARREEEATAVRPEPVRTHALL